jgi:hypothetical protein
MLVKHITKNRFDVFYNDGWENWARFEVKGGKTMQIAGVPAPKNIGAYLDKRYSK